MPTVVAIVHVPAVAVNAPPHTPVADACTRNGTLAGDTVQAKAVPNDGVRGRYSNAVPMTAEGNVKSPGDTEGISAVKVNPP